MFPLLKRTIAWLRRSRLDDELREEIDAHIAQRRQSLIDGGMDPREATGEARRLFGNVLAVRERTRDAWSFPRLESLLQDVRFGVRLLVQTPLYTAVAVLSLAIGIGAAVAVFNIADAVLFRPLPIRAPEELRAFHIEMRMGAATKDVSGVPEDALAEIQRGADFADFIGFRTAEGIALDTGAGGEGRSIRVEFVSRGYFQTLGTDAVVGRVLHDIDHEGAPSAVISERLWRAAFSRDPAVVGRPLRLNGHTLTIVGVVRGWRGLVADQPADAFVPLHVNRAVDPAAADQIVRLVGRLRPGVTTAVAEHKHAALYRVALPSIGRRIDLQATLDDASRGVSDARSSLERPVMLGLGLAAVLVLVACANTGALLMSRFLNRRGEFGIRIAIGAGRPRLARQLSIEALLVAVLAASLGLLAGWLAAPLLMQMMPQSDAQAAFELRFDHRLIAFTAILAVACAASAVAASLFKLWRGDVSGLLAVEARSLARGSRRVTRTLIAAQVACALLLTVGAISMTRTLANLRKVSLGFDVRRTFVVDVNAAGLVSKEDAADYHRVLRDRIAALPGVEHSTMSQVGILTSSSTTGTVDIAGYVPASDEDRISRMFFVGPDYFETLGMPLIAGRLLTQQDLSGRGHRAVINERFARFYFGAPTNALGRMVNTDIEIVGVVSDARYNTLRADLSRAMFLTYLGKERRQMVHTVRAHRDLAQVMASVRDIVLQHDSRLRPRISTGDALVAAAVGRETFFATIASVLAALAIVLACAGVFAAVASAVSRRRGELAVRIALGASGRDVVGLVMKDPLMTSLIGAAAGMPGAYLLLRSASSLLYGVPAFDPVTVLGSSIGLIAFALLAAAWPAKRAVSIDPVLALRDC